MEFLKFLIILGTVESAFGGGESKCGAFENDFPALLQVFESMIGGIVNLVNNSLVTTPYVTNSNIANYFCSINATTYTFAMEISRLSGVDIEYILGILQGTLLPPLMEPLDCIETELSAYYSFTQNVTSTVVPEWEALIQQSPINETTPCSTVLQIQSPYFQQDIQTATSGTNAAINRAMAFANFGKASVYLEFLDYIKICSENTLADQLAELLNMNANIVNEFLANQSIPVPQPLSCITGLVGSLVDIIDSTYDQINNTIDNPSPPSNCEPFYSQFIAFENVWFKYVNELRDHAINQSVAHPELTPFFIANLLCELDAMVLLAANATSSLSGVDSDIIFNILKGSIMPPFAAPLDCIANRLLFMSNQISVLVNSIIPGLLNFDVDSTSDTSTCNTTYQALTPYVGEMVILLNEKGIIMTNATIDFTSINMGYLFLDAFASVFDCLPNLLGKYVGAVLNDNGASVVSYVNGNRSTLPYPFSCVKIIIDILNSIINQAVVNFVTDSATNVVTAPNVPKYRG